MLRKSLEIPSNSSLFAPQRIQGMWINSFTLACVCGWTEQGTYSLNDKTSFEQNKQYLLRLHRRSHPDCECTPNLYQ